jgi:hypothetical protein
MDNNLKQAVQLVLEHKSYVYINARLVRRMLEQLSGSQKLELETAICLQHGRSGYEAGFAEGHLHGATYDFYLPRAIVEKLSK